MPRPIALTIAGSDSSGGAGIQADLKTFGAFGVYGASVLTALTAQNTRGVDGVSAVEPDFIRAQIKSVFDDLDVRAAKTGMLATTEIIHAVLDGLAAQPDLPLVVDPVMVATSGDRLLDENAVEAVRSALLPRATVLTPNLDEAAVLLDCDVATTFDEMEAQARSIAALGAPAVLVKGGHLGGAVARDVLVAAGQATWFEGPLIETRHTHGTGCTLSAALAAGLACGRPLEDAMRDAKQFLTAALDAGRTLGVGRGNGPVDHLVAWSRDAS